MPRGKEQKKQPKGKGKPKRKNPPQRQSQAYGSGVSTSTWRDDPPKMTQSGSMSKAAPVARTRIVKTGTPKMMTMRNGDCLIAHREYIQDITANTGSPSTFQATQFALNPGQVATFPWLSNVAKNFESYRFKKLKFHYETEAPSSLGGSLVQSIDYDATDAAPLTKQQAMAYRNAVRSAPWEPCCHTSAREDMAKQKSYFVRAGALPVGTDIKMYDTGNLFVCTQNVTTASAVCGELYVEYEVELLTPIWENLSGTSGVLYAAGTTGQSSAAPFGTSPVVGVGQIQLSSAGALVVAVTGLVVGQEYAVSAFEAGTVITGPIAVGSSVGLTYKSGGSGFPAAATSSQLVETYTATATSATITLTNAATSVTSCAFIVALIPTQIF